MQKTQNKNCTIKLWYTSWIKFLYRWALNVSVRKKDANTSSSGPMILFKVSATCITVIPKRYRTVLFRAELVRSGIFEFSLRFIFFFFFYAVWQYSRYPPLSIGTALWIGVRKMISLKHNKYVYRLFHIQLTCRLRTKIDQLFCKKVFSENKQTSSYRCVEKPFSLKICY